MKWSIPVACALLVSACCVRCSPEQTSYVDVPTKLADVQARAKPPDVVVTVERKTRTSGGGGCGHSAACLILVPLIVYELAFPEKYDEVAVTEAGVETFHGIYTTSGDLLSARVKNADGWRELAQLDLPELNQRAVVERAKVSTLPDGGEARTPTTIQSQVDLLAQYRAALAKRDGERRGKLLAEAAFKLDGEGDAFVLERLAAKDEPDESRAVVVNALCNHGHEGAKQKAATFLPAALTHEGPRTARVTLECELADAPILTVAATQLTRALCAAKRGVEARTLSPDNSLKHGPALTAGIEAGAAGCTKGGVVIAKLALREPVSTEVFLEALQAPEGDVVADLVTPADRTFIFAALEKRLHPREMTKLLAKGGAMLTLNELNLLLDVAFEQPKTADGWKLRASIATAISSAGELRPKVEPRLAKVPAADQKTAQAFLAVLGDTKARDRLADAVPPGDVGAFSISSENEFVADALLTAGCDRHGLNTGKKSRACTRAAE